MTFSQSHDLVPGSPGRSWELDSVILTGPLQFYIYIKMY